MLTDIYLYGNLAEKYGAHHRFDVPHAVSACRALAVNFKGFESDFRDGFYDVKIGQDPIRENQIALKTGGRDIHITPIAQGAKRSGGLKAVAGIALLSIATFGASTAALPWLSGTAAIGSGFGATAFTIAGYSVTYGSLALSGGLMLLQGASSLLSPSPKADYSTRNPVDQRASFLFNGVTNRSADGTPLQLVYGEFLVGSIVASAGIYVEQV